LLPPVRKFLQLDREHKSLFLQAWSGLAAVRLELRSRSFKELTAGLTLHRPPFEPLGLHAEAMEQAQRIGWAVRAASRYTPWSSTCLVQVLAAQRMLQKRSIPGAFYIGAAPGNGAPDKVGLAAHAWLKCGEQFITGEAGHQHYTVVSTFSWP
jgi:hypothetical protein